MGIKRYDIDTGTYGNGYILNADEYGDVCYFDDVEEELAREAERLWNAGCEPIVPWQRADSYARAAFLEKAREARRMHGAEIARLRSELAQAQKERDGFQNVCKNLGVEHPTPDGLITELTKRSRTIRRQKEQNAKLMTVVVAANGMIGDAITGRDVAKNFELMRQVLAALDSKEETDAKET